MIQGSSILFFSHFMQIPVIHSTVIQWFELQYILSPELEKACAQCVDGLLGFNSLKIICLSHRHNVGCSYGLLTCACVPVSHLPACQHGFIGPCGVYGESSKTCVLCGRVCFSGEPW